MLSYEKWTAALRACCGHYYSEPTKGALAPGSFDVLDLYGLDMAVLRCSIDRIDRTRQGIRRDESEHLFLLYQVEGQTGVRHNEREELLEPGDFLLLDSTRRAELIFGGKTSEFRSLHLPRSLCLVERGFMPSIGKRLSRRHPLHAGLVNLMDAASGTDNEAFMSDYLFDFVAMVFGPDPSEITISQFRNRQSRMRFVQDVVDRNLSQHEFNVEQLSGLVGLSRRQLQREFHCEGTNFTRYLRDRRLKHLVAAKVRSDRLGLGKSLSELAQTSGFCDQAHFNRVFREKYAASPSEYFGYRGRLI
jgi:AraC-like DNA-binding protein